jgi:competence protein ComEC
VKQDSQRTSGAEITLYPLAWLAAAFAVGILVSSGVAVNVWVWVTGVLLLALAALLLKRSRGMATSSILLLAFVCAGGLFQEVGSSSVRADRLKLLYDNGTFKTGEPVGVKGTLPREPELAINGFFLWIAAENLRYQNNETKVSGTVRMFVPVNDELAAQAYEAMSLGAGGRIQVEVELKREDRYLNPGVRSAKENLDWQGIDATGTIKSPEDITKLSAGNSPLAFIYRWRAQLLREFRERFSVSTAGVLNASLLGNKYHLDKPTGEAFREGGTFHLLVISGGHITLLGALIVWLLSFVTRRRAWLFVISNAILWAYTLAVGAEAPVARAALMFTVLSFAYVVQRQGTLLNALGFSALILLVWQPSQLFDPSFQLTFACVFAIVAVALPLLQKLEAIGSWYPTAKEPLPPNVSPWLKTFCEILFFSEAKWRREQKRNIWQCVLFKTKWARKLEERGAQTVLRYLFAAALVSVVVQLWLLPFLVVYFHRISPAGIVLNLFVGILLAAETFTAIFSVWIAAFSTTLAAPFIWLTENLNWLMLHSVDPFNAYDVAALRLPAYTGWARMIYVLYFLPLAGLWIRALRWKPFAPRKVKDDPFGKRLFFSPHFSGAALLILLAVIIFHPFTGPRPDGKLRIDFLDVGQGDSALLTFPDGTTMLIDGGGRFNFRETKVTSENGKLINFEPDISTVGEAVVSEFLWQRGLDRVDYLAATHGDLDHIQGLNDVARNFAVRAAFVGAGQRPSENFKQFYETLARRNIPVVETARGDVFKFGPSGEVTVEVLSPSAETVRLSENNNSLVLKVTFGERSFLFTGDIEREAEESLLEDPGKLRCDLIKVPHHGSHSSSSENFVAATQAKTAVISVGRTSPFGHPHREVLERWTNSGANTMTTGSNGTITVITDGHEISLNSYLENQTHP